MTPSRQTRTTCLYEPHLQGWAHGDHGGGFHDAHRCHHEPVRLTIFQKEVRGALFGGGSPRADIPRLLAMYQAGALKLDELITKTYPLEQINEGYQDIRGMIEY